ncbi:DUF6602 domain-containing protein [Sorangium sp. So ce145]|uniref:DUF6602 domain-containing protein n=1 Tax=Sorangium sp. So ce145 TaxID=3133285 RepID=UPI003F60EBA2
MNLAELLRNRLRAQADLFAALTNHPTVVGSGREHALAELLREVVPRRLEVLTGAIARVDDQGQPQLATAQADIMLVDTIDYPMLLRVGTTVVAIPQAVRAVVEVKSGLARGAKFIDAVDQLGRLQLDAGADNPFVTALFSFGAPTKSATFRGWLEDVIEARAKRGNAVTAASDAEAKRTAREAQAALAPPFLPDLLFSDEGAIAMKIDDAGKPAYRFYECEAGAPTAVAFLDQMMMLTAPRVLETVPADPAVAGRVTKAFRLVSSFLRAPLAEAKKCAILQVA